MYSKSFGSNKTPIYIYFFKFIITEERTLLTSTSNKNNLQLKSILFQENV